MKKETIVPFIKWVGGKRQLLNVLLENIPTHFNNYFEPFIGGGALLFALQPKSAVINDLNQELVITYRSLKEDVDILTEYLLLMEYAHNEDFFKKIAQVDRNEKDPKKISLHNSTYMRAARFIYLNKTCFNGLYRVNKKGYYNVPSGKKEVANTFDPLNIKAVSNFLKINDVKVLNEDFEKVTSMAKSGDFVYLDPPYDYEVENGFDSYQKNGFGKEGQVRLANICKHMHQRGVKFMVSNHNTKLINELYKEFTIIVVKAKRLVGGKGADRKDVEEVLIKNYE